MEKSVEELEKEITCAICHEHYTEPRVLPCLHYYCQDCIAELAKRADKNRPFSCPECRSDTTLPQGGVASLKPAFFINRMKAVHSKLSLAQGKVEAICEECSGDKATAFCRQCTQFICEECVKTHGKLKTFSGHRTVSLEELKKGGAAQEVVMEEPPLQTCPQHDESMKIYCFDCSKLICLYCTVKDHNDHNHEFTKKATPKVRKELLEELVGLKEMEEAFSRSVGEIRSSKSEVEAGVKAATAEIKSSFKELRQILGQHEKKLIKKAEDRGAEKLKSLSAQEKKLSTSHAVIQSVIDYTEQFVEHSVDDQVMGLHAEVQSRIRQEIAERKRDDLHPVEEAEIVVEVSCAEDLKQLCRDKAKLPKLHIEITVAGEGVKSAVVGKKSEISVTAKWSCNGKPVRRNLSLKCDLKSLLDDSTTKCQVDRVEGGYHIQYTPTLRGRHEVILSAPGLKIAGSPFSVFASIHPTQLVKPVREIREGLPENPMQVCLNSKGEMIVIGDCCITAFNKEKKKVASLNIKQEMDLQPCGLAVDNHNDDDNMVYVVCRRGARSLLVKLTQTLKIVKKSDKFDTNLSNVSVVDNRLMVCEEGVGLHVFTKDLGYERKIHLCSEHLKKIRDMSSDGHGICGLNSPVYVFNAYGQLLRSFGEEKLRSQYHGLRVTGDYVFIADKGSHDVLVYTTEGEYVTSLKQQANYKFKRPCGVCIDEDGFIYICNCSGKGISIF